MDALTPVLIVALLATGVVGGPILAALIVQRDGPWAAFLRKHVRSVWVFVAACWALVAGVGFSGAQGFSSLSAWAGVVACVSALFLARSAMAQDTHAH